MPLLALLENHLEGDVEKQQATVRSYLTTIEDLNNQIAELEEERSIVKHLLG